MLVTALLVAALALLVLALAPPVGPHSRRLGWWPSAVAGLALAAVLVLAYMGRL